MDLVQLVYSSQPFGYDSAILSQILMDARRLNERDGITGALICRGDIYLQRLEGPKAAVEAAYERIKRDDRHLEVTLHVSEPAAARMFADWAMLHDPVRSWLWTQDEISGGALLRASAEEIRGVFARLVDGSAAEADG